MRTASLGVSCLLAGVAVLGAQARPEGDEWLKKPVDDRTFRTFLGFFAYDQKQALDLRNLLLASELIARSALLREDSRGAHFRSDFEHTDNARWLQNIYLGRNGTGLKSWTVPVKLDRLRP